LLETERLLLRKPRIEDAAEFARIYADEEAMRFIGGVVAPEDVPAIVQRWLDRWEANGFGHFVIARRQDDCIVGRVGVLVWDTRTWDTSTLPEAGEHGQIELGWSLAREHWGHGYAPEGARAVRSWVRSECGVSRLISIINPLNVASQRVAEKLGATPGETIRLFDASDAVVWVHPE
jgi:RimJ/RimL family protein N-acetyltransferase